ncbi:MAG: acyl carrier protein [Deltaproteobacteria bacterium]|nr:acyl carrier protein [Deltaproteobacteria bacterium]
MSIDLRAIEARIREGIVTTTGYEGPLASDQSLRLAAVFDSYNVIELVVYLEQVFGVRIESDDMVESTFESINSLMSFIASKQRAEAAAA